MLIRRQDDGCAFVDQCIERVQELILGSPFCRQEVDIVNDQAASTSVARAKITQAASSHGFQEAVGECLRSELSNIQIWVRLSEDMGDTLEQVCFSQSDSAMNNKRVESSAG